MMIAEPSIMLYLFDLPQFSGQKMNSYSSKLL